jgi:hypothetical protein
MRNVRADQAARARVRATGETLHYESARQNDPTQISDVKGLACRSASDPHADSQSAVISTFIIAAVHIRALTAAHRIKPTSPRCRSARQPNPGRRSTYRCGDSVQTIGTSSVRPGRAFGEMTLGGG